MAPGSVAGCSSAAHASWAVWRALIVAVFGPSTASGARVFGAGPSPGVNFGVEPSVGAKEYKVYLLVTRHGLSCTNVVQKWVSKYDFGRANIHDPLLSGAARSDALKARGAALGWLAAHNLTLDAVVSSVLARAMETAILTFPQGAANPLHIVPYIRELARGKSNYPKEPRDQVVDLTRSLAGNGTFHLDYQWTNVFGRDGASWPDFERFLEQSFLPTLLETTGKPSGSPVVVAVVTHSKFVKESKLASSCQEFWTSKGEKKPLNNQILIVPYTFSVSDPPADSADSTTRYTLAQSQIMDGSGSSVGCDEVFGGIRLKDQHGKARILCLPDIGDECIGPIRQYSLSPDSLYGSTREAEILKLAKTAEKQEKKRAEAFYRVLNHSVFMSIGRPTKQEKHTLDKYKQEFHTLNSSLYGSLDEIRHKRESQCWSGRLPDVLRYTRYKGIDSSRVASIALGAGAVDLRAPESA